MYSLITPNPLVCWQTLISSCDERYVYFPELVVGGGGFDSSPALPSNRRNHGRSAYWWNFRNHALNVTGFKNSLYFSKGTESKKMVIAVKHKTLGNHTQKSYRVFTNVYAAYEAICRAFPDARTVLYDFPSLSQLEEIHLLATSDVFITPIGGLGFAMPFLPRGAASIVVGTRTFTDKHLHIGHGHNLPFVETDILWKHISYIRTYHHVARPTKPGQPRTTNFIIDIENLLQLIRQAQRETFRGERV